jgi:hypothetical protein
VKAYGQRSVVEFLMFGGPAYRVYVRSKLGNVLFTTELARRMRAPP